MTAKKKKKLLIIGSCKGAYGGIEAFMIAMAEAAAQWEEFEVCLCFKMVKGASLQKQLIQLAEKACPNVRYVQRGSLELLKQILWADVLHVQNTPPDIIFPARLAGKRILLTVHNRKLPRISLHNLIWGISIKFAHQRWFNSNFVWNTWEPGLKRTNSDCVPTVCKLPHTTCPPEDRKGFLYVGRWIKNKGIEEIIKAYKISDFNANEWPLVLLGDGPIKTEVIQLLKELQLDSVIMPGFVDDKTKEQYIASSKWLLAPAKTKEDLGLTPIEARNVGVPSIVTRDGGLPESGGEAALIAEPGDVEDLARCMQQAVEMESKEYVRRSSLAKESLKQFLKPMTFYRSAFKN